MDGARAKRRRTFWVAAGIIAISAAAFLSTYRPAPAEEPRTVKADVVPPGIIEATAEQQKQFRVEAAREDIVDVNLEATGKVGFNEDRVTPILAPFPGRVLEVLGSVGDAVQSGQPLLVIESPDLVAAVNDLFEAHTNLGKAKIAVDIAEKSAERARRLHDQEAISTKDLQAAESDLARAQEDYRRGQSALEVVRNRVILLGKSPAEIASLENSAANQTDRRIMIRAPISGTLVDRKVGLGQYIKPDTTDPLFLISDLSSVWITADVYENDLPHIRVGAPVDIRVAAYPGMDFSARISSINPTVDPATRTIKVRCTVANRGGLLKPEMFARIRVGNATREKVVLIPSQAILTEGEHSFVLVEEAAGQFRRREVKPGPEIGSNTAIRDGIRANERVVTSGVLLLNSEVDK
jgi:cobalt-zinc-cadmium efflux system membrane fusion protein